MKESYRKGVANHLTSSLAVTVARPWPKRRHEASVGWVLSFEKQQSGCRLCGQKGKAKPVWAIARVQAEIPRSRRPQAR